MKVTSATFECDMCGHEEPHPSAEEAAKSTEWPQHCGVGMGLARTTKCDMCGYEETTRRECDPSLGVISPYSSVCG